MSADPYLAGIMAKAAISADKSDEASVVEPGAIDLDELQARRKPFDGQLSVADTDRLIAAIVALRARVAELEVFTGHLRASRDHAVQANEAAEACVAELAGALGVITDAYVSFSQDVEKNGGYGLCNREGSKEVITARTVLAAMPAEALARAMRRKLVKQEFINVYDPNETRGKAGMHSLGRSSLPLANEGAMPGRDAIIIREVYETRYEEREIEDIAKLNALDKKEKEDA